MMPLLPPLEILYSSDNSNEPYLSAVTISPAPPAARVSAPSTTFQPLEIASFLKLRQPLVVSPSKSSFQPAFSSSAVSLFTGLSAAVAKAERAHRAAKTDRTRRRNTIFMAEVTRRGRGGDTIPSPS